MSNLLIDQDAPFKPKYHTKPLKVGSVMHNAVETPVYNSKTLAPPVKAFACQYLKPQRGFRAGLPLEFTKWQDWLIDNILELDENGLLRYKTAVVMLPRKNGKTFIAAILVISQLMMSDPGAEIYSAAVDRAQARIVFEQVKLWIEASPILSQVLEVRDSKNTIVNTQTKSFYRALSSDGSRTEGYAPSFLIIDELHAFEAQSSSRRAVHFYNALTKGSADRPESQTVIISTAGANLNDSLLGSLYKRGKKAAEDPMQDKAFGFFCWEADEEDDPLDEKTWWKANPNIAEGLMNVDALRNALRDGASIGMGGFMRYHLNIWASVEGDPFMSAHHWANAVNKDKTEIKPGSRITIGMDASHNNDATAITICDYDDPKGFIQLYRVWERPIDADDKWFIPRNEVIATVHELFKKYQVVIMYADRKYYTQEIREWQIVNGYRVQEYAQDPVTISGASSRFRAGVIDGTVTHGDQEALTRHIMNALDDPRKGFKKATKREKVDGLAASVMAVAGRDFFKLQERAADHWKVTLDNDDEDSFFS